MVSKWFDVAKGIFRRVWLPSQIMFSIFLEAWILSITIIVTLKTVSAGSVAVTYFWIASYVFIVLALLTLIRIKIEPKDNRLDILTTEIKGLREEVHQLLVLHTPPKQIDIRLINKEIRERLAELKEQTPSAKK